jgi:D-alanyl-D-alanine carboxypeptidase
VVNRDSFRRDQKKELLARLSKSIAEEDSGPVKVSNQNTNTEEKEPVSDKSWKAHERRMWAPIVPGLIPPFVVMVALIWVLVVPRSGANSNNTSYAYIGPLPHGTIVGPSFGIGVPQPGLQCIALDDTEEPDIHAEAYLAVFADTFDVAFEKEKETELPFASIVKLLGALVVEEEYDMNAMIGLLEPVDAEGNGMDLEVGEKARVRDLLAAALIGSRNDAMYAIAQNYSGGTEGFVGKMREMALRLGMSRTSVQNVVGLDSPEQYSTVSDVAVLVIAAMQNSELASLMSQTSYTIRTSYGREESIGTTNALLGKVEGVIGGKTGYTEDAGLSLVTYIDDGPDFVTVVFNAEDRYAESEKLIQAVREGYQCR